jgi:heme-degrading monooxygenase HmoA
MSEPVVLINSFEVAAADAAPFITAWERARDYLRAQPGYIDTTLHQSLGPDAEFQFVNVAHWRSVEDFTAATRSPSFGAAAAGLAGYPSHPALYRPART